MNWTLCCHWLCWRFSMRVTYSSLQHYCCMIFTGGFSSVWRSLLLHPVSLLHIMYICCVRTFQRLSLSMQWPQTLPPTCRWAASGASMTSWQSAGPAPPSSRTFCFRPNIRYATDWRTAPSGRCFPHTLQRLCGDILGAALTDPVKLLNLQPFSLYSLYQANVTQHFKTEQQKWSFKKFIRLFSWYFQRFTIWINCKLN